MSLIAMVFGRVVWVIHNGVTIFFRGKHTLSDGVASEATPSLRHRS